MISFNIYNSIFKTGCIITALFPILMLSLWNNGLVWKCSILVGSVLNFYLNIDNGKLITRLYDKRDDFNFPIVNFPFMSSNIPSAPAYGVYVSQLVRYDGACYIYEDFVNRGKLLTSKLLLQGYRWAKLVSTPKKFYVRHHDLVDPYSVDEPKLVTDLMQIAIKNDFFLPDIHFLGFVIIHMDMAGAV